MSTTTRTRLGVDLGTTWIAAATHGPDGPVAVALGERASALSAVVAVGDDGGLLTGRQAAAVLLAHPDRGAREIKRRFGDPAPFVLGAAPWSADALTAALLQDVVRTAAVDPGATDLVLTHPANWGEFKLDLLRNVGEQAGCASCTLLAEPVAAALHYVSSGRLGAGDVVAVYDFGGGTFDVAVLRIGDTGATVLASHGLERLGGIDIDQIVLAHVVDALGGTVEHLDRNDPAVRRAMHQLRVDCTAVKELLSDDSEAVVDVAMPGLSTQIRITRTELEDVLRPRLHDTLQALDRALASAEVGAGELAGVVLVGGSSRIPLVAELVAAHTKAPVLFDADPKLAVAMGAALDPAAVRPRHDLAPPTAERSTEMTTTPNESEQSDAGQATKSSAARPGAAVPPPPPPPGATPRSRGRMAAMAGAGVAAAAAGAVLWGEEVVDAVTGGDPQAMPESMDIFDDLDGPPPAARGPLGPDGELLSRLPGGLRPPLPDGVDGPGGPLGGPGLGPSPLGFRGPLAPPGGPHPGGQFAPPQAHAAPPQPAHHAPRPQRHDDDRPARRERDRDRDDRDRDDREERGDAARPGDARPSADSPEPDPAFEASRDKLLERIDDLKLDDDVSSDDAAELRAELSGLVERFEPRPGQTRAEALAELRDEYEQRIQDFTQDRKIDAIIDEQRRDNATSPTPAPPAPTPTPAPVDPLVDPPVDPAHAGLYDDFEAMVDPLPVAGITVGEDVDSLIDPLPTDASPVGDRDILGVPRAAVDPADVADPLAAPAEFSIEVEPHDVAPHDVEQHDVEPQDVEPQDVEPVGDDPAFIHLAAMEEVEMPDQVTAASPADSDDAGSPADDDLFN